MTSSTHTEKQKTPVLAADSTTNWRDVFISHSSDDAELALQICKQLEDSGLECWIAPRDIPLGSYPEQIDDGINRSRCVLLILSESSNKSNWVLREITTAASLNKIIMSFQTAELTPRKGLRILISDQQGLAAWSSPAKHYFKQLTLMLTQACRASEIEPKPGQLSLKTDIGSPDSKKRPLHILITALTLIASAGALAFGLKNWLQPPEPKPKPATFVSKEFTPGPTIEPTDPPAIASPTISPILEKLKYERDLVKIEYQQSLNALKIDGWPEAEKLRSQANKIVSSIHDTTDHAQAAESYSIAKEKLNEADRIFQSARRTVNGRILLAKDIITDKSWCEECPEILETRQELSTQLDRIHARSELETLSITSQLVSSLFLQLDDLKIQNAAQMTLIQDTRRTTIQNLYKASLLNFDRITASFTDLKELKSSALSSSVTEANSTRIVSQQAGHILMTLELNGQGKLAIDSKLGELKALSLHTSTIPIKDVSHAKSLQSDLLSTALLLEGYVAMLNAEFEARNSFNILIELLDSSPTTHDKPVAFFDRSLTDAVVLRKSAIQSSNKVMAAHALTAFDELQTLTSDAVIQNRQFRFQQANDISQSVSDTIRDKYSQFFQAGLRIPPSLQSARNEFTLKTSPQNPTEHDISNANDIANRFHDAIAELESVSIQARNALNTPYTFHSSAFDNDQALLNDYCALGVSINSQRPTDLMTVLHIASAQGHLETTRWISTQPNIDLEAVDIQGYTAFALAALNGHENIVSLLARLKVNVLPLNHSSLSLVFEDSVLKNYDMMMLLLREAERNGRSVASVSGDQGRTLLIEICNSGGHGGLLETEQIDIVKKLLALGIDILAKGTDKVDAKAMAKMNGAHELAKFLDENGG